MQNVVPPFMTRGWHSGMDSVRLMAKDGRLGLLVERFSALSAAGVAAAICWWQWGQVPFPPSWKELLVSSVALI